VGVEADGPAVTRAELLAHIQSQPFPRFLVVEHVGDLDSPTCFWGEVHATLHRAVGCVAGLTNGPVRDLPEMEAAGFETFATGLALGGGAPMVQLAVGVPVTVGGLTVRPGDLLHGDRHGVVRIPPGLAAALPDAVRSVEAYERALIAACRAP